MTIKNHIQTSRFAFLYHSISSILFSSIHCYSIPLSSPSNAVCKTVLHFLSILYVKPILLCRIHCINGKRGTQQAYCAHDPQIDGGQFAENSLLGSPQSPNQSRKNAPDKEAFTSHVRCSSFYDASGIITNQIL